MDYEQSSGMEHSYRTSLLHMHFQMFTSAACPSIGKYQTHTHAIHVFNATHALHDDKQMTSTYWVNTRAGYAQSPSPPAFGLSGGWSIGGGAPNGGMMGGINLVVPSWATVKTDNRTGT